MFGSHTVHFTIFAKNLKSLQNETDEFYYKIFGAIVCHYL